MLLRLRFGQFHHRLDMGSQFGDGSDALLRYGLRSNAGRSPSPRGKKGYGDADFCRVTAFGAVPVRYPSNTSVTLPVAKHG